MTLRDYTANVISASKVVPDGNFKDSKASGVWDINEALDLIKGGNWPNAANINPAAFVDNLFQTHLWTGNGTSDRTITNNINLSGKGGLVWTKERNDTDKHLLIDTERGATKYLQSVNTNAEDTSSESLKVFNSNGFTIGNLADINGNNDTFVSWTFRKQPKFFDIVTYTGDNTSNRAISHNLGSTPGMIICKSTSSGQWGVWHRSLSGNNGLRLDSTAAAGGSLLHDSSTVNSTSFEVSSGGYVLDNQNQDYVAYLFAHNNNDGGFGEPGDQDIIKCGSFTNSGSGVEVDLGFEPQFMMFKRTDSSGNWGVVDVMRGIPTPVNSAGDNSNQLRWNLNNAENAEYHPFPTPTGFKVVGAAGGGGGGSGTFIYMAIRRGGMQTPTVASDVFDVHKTTDNSSTTSAFDVGFVSDFAIHRETDASAVPYAFTRLLGGRNYLRTSGSNAEADSSVTLGYDWTLQNSVENNVDGGSPHIFYNWRRARGYFDVVTYIGNDTAGRTVSHNLGVVPEMMWTKRRNSTGGDWDVYHKDIGNTKYLTLNSTAAASTSQYTWNNTTPTASVFTIATGANNTNGDNFVAYLFATAAGVSKVGSFSGNSGTQTIDCGFSGGTGARFLFIKAHSTTGGWFLWDSERGIVSGNDPYLLLNSGVAEETGYDAIDSHSSGFTLNNVGAGTNDNGTDYIFYAIA